MILVSVGTKEMCCSDLKDSLHGHDRLIALVANPQDPPLSVVFILAIPVSVKQYVIVVMICIFDDEHFSYDNQLFAYLLWINVY